MRPFGQTPTRRGLFRTIGALFGVGFGGSIAEQLNAAAAPRPNPGVLHVAAADRNYPASVAIEKPASFVGQGDYINGNPNIDDHNKNQGAPREETKKFSTIDQAASAIIPPSINTIFILRHNPRSPVCPALYSRPKNEKRDTTGRFKSQDGSLWELVETTVAPEMFGAVGDDLSDDTSAVQAALDFGRNVYFSRTYLVTRTISLRSSDTSGYGLHLYGNSSQPKNSGIHLVNPKATSLFTSSDAPDGYLAGLTIENLRFLGPGVQAGDNLHCFKIYGLTNNSTFRNVLIQQFSGNAINVSKNTGSDATACGNVVMSQLFCTAIGGFAFRCTGRINATFIEPDFNRVGGDFYLSNCDGPGLAQCSIIGLWHEGNLSGNVAIILENMANTPVNVFGATFNGPKNGAEIVRIKGETKASVTLIGCSQNGFLNWIRDEVAGTELPVRSAGSNIAYIDGSFHVRNQVIRSEDPFLQFQHVKAGNRDDTVRLRHSSAEFVVESKSIDSGRFEKVATFSLDQNDFRLGKDGKALIPGGIGVGNSISAKTAGVIIRQMAVYDLNGKSLGFVPIYDFIK